MNKGLDALTHIKKDYCNKCGGNCISCTIKDIEKQLKALEELEIMYSNCVIESAKQKKALEIIKNNIFEFIFVDITKLIIVCFGETSWNYYCKTQEEYDLLKEILK